MDRHDKRYHPSSETKPNQATIRLVATALLSTAIIASCVSQTKIEQGDGYLHIDWPSITTQQGDGVSATTWFIQDDILGEKNLATDIKIKSGAREITHQTLAYKNDEEKYPVIRSSINAQDHP